jgi:hypothetical protein
MASDTWQIVIQAAAAFGTLLAVAVAIWGDWFRSVLAPPSLSVSLRDREGELTTQDNGVKVRYYHLAVANPRRWAPAKNVTVYVNLLESPGPDGRWRPAMVSGPIPLVWQFGIVPSHVGHTRLCDLAKVVNGGDFQLTTLFLPNNFPGILTGPGKLRCQCVAIADNAESEPCAVEFAWDGQWADGAKEMSSHLVVTQVSPSRRRASVRMSRRG